MSLIKLEFYTIRLHKRGIPDSFEKFDEIFEDRPFSNFFEQFVNEFIDRYDNHHQKRTFKFESGSLKFGSNKRIISGIIKGGTFGITSEVENVVTGQTKPRIEPDDSVINPYYFLIYFPENSSIGLVILQKKGGNGIVTDFRDYFKKFIKNETSDLILDMSPFASKEVLLKLIEQSQITQISFKKYNNVSDTWDRYRDAAGPSKELNAQLILSTKNFFGQSVKNKIEEFVKDSRSNFFEISELEELGFNGEVETSIKLEHDRRERVVVLNDVDKFKLSFDVTSYIDFNADGHPEFNSIDAEAKSLLNDHFHV